VVGQSGQSADYGCMKLRISLALLSLAAVAGLASAACGGGDDKSNGNTSNPAEDGLAGPGAKALRDLAKDLTGKSYHAVYKIENDDGAGKTDKGTLTIAAKPPKSAFAVSTVDSDGAKTDFNSFQDDKFSYLCTKDDDGKGECIKSKVTDPTEDAGIFDIGSLLTSLEGDEKTTVTEIKGRKIAGADSKCFAIKDSTSEGTACFAKATGIMTFVDSNDNGSLLKIEATKIDDKPDDKLFEVLDLEG
jgi:hypothetical protein